MHHKKESKPEHFQGSRLSFPVGMSHSPSQFLTVSHPQFRISRDISRSVRASRCQRLLGFTRRDTAIWRFRLISTDNDHLRYLHGEECIEDGFNLLYIENEEFTIA